MNDNLSEAIETAKVKYAAYVRASFAAGVASQRADNAESDYVQAKNRVREITQALIESGLEGGPEEVARQISSGLKNDETTT